MGEKEFSKEDVLREAENIIKDKYYNTMSRTPEYQDYEDFRARNDVTKEEYQENFKENYIQARRAELTRKNDDGTHTTVSAYELFASSDGGREDIAYFALQAVQSGYKILGSATFQTVHEGEPANIVQFYLEDPTQNEPNTPA